MDYTKWTYVRQFGLHRETRDAYDRIIRIDEYQGTFTSCTSEVGFPYGTTRNQYDVTGNLRYVTDARSNQTEMRYDSLSRKTFMHDPDMGNWTYTYDVGGNLTRQTDAKGQDIFFRYDALNRRRQKDYGTQKVLGSGDVVYTYDGVTSYGKGRLTSVQDPSGTTTFYYDSVGRPRRSDKIINGSTYITQSTFDLQGRVTSVTYPDASVVTNEYNGSLLKRVYEGSTNYIQYAGYDPLGQPGTLTFGNAVVTNYTYSNSQNAICPQQHFRMCTIKTTRSTSTYQDLQYTYDSGGNITAIIDSVNGNQTLGYDAINRLTSAVGPDGTVNYVYNSIGNLLDNSQIGTYFYPSSGNFSVRPHAVFTAGPNTYNYDNNGNMTNGAGGHVCL